MPDFFSRYISDRKNKLNAKFNTDYVIEFDTTSKSDFIFYSLHDANVFTPIQSFELDLFHELLRLTVFPVLALPSLLCVDMVDNIKMINERKYLEAFGATIVILPMAIIYNALLAIYSIITSVISLVTRPVATVINEIKGTNCRFDLLNFMKVFKVSLSIKIFTN